MKHEPFIIDERGFIIENPKAKKPIEAAPRAGPTFREFDAGPVPDLHDETLQREWTRLGKHYIDGVGPVINNNEELRAALEISGHVVHGQTRVVEESRDGGLFGRERVNKTKRRITDGFEPVWGKFDRGEASEMMADHQRQIAARKAEARRQQEAERQRGLSKKYHFFGQSGGNKG